MLVDWLGKIVAQTAMPGCSSSFGCVSETKTQYPSLVAMGMKGCPGKSSDLIGCCLVAGGRFRLRLSERLLDGKWLRGSERENGKRKCSAPGVTHGPPS